jgi:hypothetical protein
MVKDGNDPNAIIKRLKTMSLYVRDTDPTKYLIYKSDADWAMRNLLLRTLTPRVVVRRVVRRKSPVRRSVVKRVVRVRRI